MLGTGLHALTAQAMIFPYDRNLAEQHYAEGTTLYNQESYLKALEHFEKAMEYAPDATPVYYGIGATYLKLRRCDRALRFLNLYLFLAPEGKYAEKARVDRGTCPNAQESIEDEWGIVEFGHLPNQDVTLDGQKIPRTGNLAYVVKAGTHQLAIPGSEGATPLLVQDFAIKAAQRQNLSLMLVIKESSAQGVASGLSASTLAWSAITFGALAIATGVIFDVSQYHTNQALDRAAPHGERAGQLRERFDHQRTISLLTYSGGLILWGAAAAWWFTSAPAAP